MTTSINPLTEHHSPIAQLSTVWSLESRYSTGKVSSDLFADCVGDGRQKKTVVDIVVMMFSEFVTIYRFPTSILGKE